MNVHEEVNAIMADADAAIKILQEAIQAARDLAISADTAELFLRETHPGHAQSLRAKVKAWIDCEAALRAAGIETEEEGK